jgi:glucosamine--fructose-6-phosphate aminotransferase (isomerizing)
LKSNLEEVRARGGELFVFADTDAPLDQRGDRGAVIKVASGGNLIAPAVFTVPLQMLAYHVAVLRRPDLDQPPNHAKSLTVE